MAASSSTALFGLNLLTLQSNHRAVYTSADSSIFHQFCSTNPTFLSFLEECNPTPTKLASKEFGLRELYDLLGADYEKLETMVNPDNVPILQLLNAKVYGKIARTCANLDAPILKQHARGSRSATPRFSGSKESVERDNNPDVVKPTNSPARLTAGELSAASNVTKPIVTTKPTFTEAMKFTASEDYIPTNATKYLRRATTANHEPGQDSYLGGTALLKDLSKDELFAKISEVFARKEEMKAARARKEEMLRSL